MRKLRIVLAVMFVLAVPTALHAQGGCVNSPENPTALLGLVGAAALGWSHWRAKR